MQNIPGIRTKDVRRVIVSKMLSQAPGVYTLLKGLARKVVKSDPTDLFLRNPRMLFNLLMEHYQDRVTATFVFRNLFIKPLAEYLGLYDKVDELTKAAIEGCDELLKVINNLNSSVVFDEIGLCVSDDSEAIQAGGGGGGGRHVSYLVPSRLTASLIEEL